MFEPTLNLQYRITGAVLAGVAYGLLLRIGFEYKAMHEWLQIVSTAFLIVTPFSIGGPEAGFR
ncbi:hypothetical protein ACO0K9_27210 [Undibacterium sp. Ji50W]|uniref:hypothetical protein n=1 Tax=Undibacterium sp. Ji50W TaxID=3413041 RepID=UPI003BF2BD8C